MDNIDSLIQLKMKEVEFHRKKAQEIDKDVHDMQKLLKFYKLLIECSRATGSNSQKDYVLNQISKKSFVERMLNWKSFGNVLSEYRDPMGPRIN